MTTPINTLIRKSFKSSFRLALVGTLAAGRDISRGDR